MKVIITHTPGPWRFIETRIGISVLAERSGQIIAKSPFRDEQGRADALLIAAAPELLAALKEVIELADTLGNEPDWLGKASVAIAKATGGAT